MKKLYTPSLTCLQVHQLLQTQTTEKTESLSIKMNSLAVEAQKETIAMRIITIVTLFFLPATFVSVSVLLIFVQHDWLT